MGSDTAQIRLLEALRSLAPGNWSDDRYAQSRAFTSIPYVAIVNQCRQLQRSEFQVFKKDKDSQDGKREITEDDPPEGGRQCKPYDLVKLLGRPNKQDSWGKYVYRIVQQLKLTGVGLTWMVPNVFGVPMELFPIPTCIAIPQPVINPDYPNGYWRIQPVYPYGPFSSYPTPTTSVGAPIPAEWMMRMMYPHPVLRYDGYSPMTGGRLQIDQAEQIDRSRWYKMKKSINPNAVVNMTDVEGAVPFDWQEIERMRTEIENAFAGVENHGNLVVCPPGGTLEEFGKSPQEMDYASSWNQITDFLLGGVYGIPKAAAGMSDASSYSGLFAALKQMHLVTLEPDCEDLGSELTHQLGPFFGDDLIVEIRCPRIDDQEQKQSAAKFLMDAKALTKGEARTVVGKILGLDIFDDERDDELAGEGDEGEQGQEGAVPGMEAPGATEGPGTVANGVKPPSTGGNRLGEPLKSPNVDEDPQEATRPDTGKLGEGSLGPRKRLPNRIAGLKIKTKSFYEQVGDALRNGNGRH